MNATMNALRLSIVGAGILTTGFGVSPTTAAPKKSNITHMYGMSGTCHHLSMGKADISDKCANVLINRDIGNGTATEFLFTLQDGSMVFFHGSQGQAHSDPDTALQTLTGAGFIQNGVTKGIPATGLCRFTNPFKGPATVHCEANTELGPYIGDFATDGTEPKKFK